MKQPFLLVLFAFFLLAPLLTYGQANYWTDKVYYIKPKPKNRDYVEREIYVSKVIDKREQKDHLGGVLVVDSIYKAQFKQPFEETIEDVFMTMFPFKESLLPTTVVVHQFLIEEYNEFGITTVDLQFFANDTTKSFFRIKQSLDIKGIDVTSKHRKVVVDLLADCLKKANIKAAELLKTEKISQQDSPKLTLPLEKGIYNDFYSMVLRRFESTVPFAIVKRNNDKVERFELKHLEEDRKKIKEAFVASDGKDLFVNSRSIYQNFKKHNNKKNYKTPLSNNYYLKVKSYGRYLYFEDRVSSSVASFLYGALGALTTIRKVGFAFDTKDGTINLLDTEFLRRITEGRQDVKDTYNASKKELKDKEAILRSLHENSKIETY